MNRSAERPVTRWISAAVLGTVLVGIGAVAVVRELGDEGSPVVSGSGRPGSVPRSVVADHVRDHYSLPFFGDRPRVRCNRDLPVVESSAVRCTLRTAGGHRHELLVSVKGLHGHRFTYAYARARHAPVPTTMASGDGARG